MKHYALALSAGELAELAELEERHADARRLFPAAFEGATDAERLLFLREIDGASSPSASEKPPDA